MHHDLLCENHPMRCARVCCERMHKVTPCASICGKYVRQDNLLDTKSNKRGQRTREGGERHRWVIQQGKRASGIDECGKVVTQQWLLHQPMEQLGAEVHPARIGVLMRAPARRATTTGECRLRIELSDRASYTVFRLRASRRLNEAAHHAERIVQALKLVLARRLDRGPKE